MFMVTGRNVNEVLQDLCWNLTISGIKEHTRNGGVLSMPEPVMVKYLKPMERVLLWPERKANPFFHLFEALWMIAGKRDVAYVAQFNKRMAEFSDNGETFHGAYGHRWRYHFGFDQLDPIINMLKTDPTTRRAVLTMWSPKVDLNMPSKDLPCNTHIYLRVIDGRLDMTVCNRSNDLIWGMCGTNVVHFSILHELIAFGAGLLMGYYYHFTNNLHIYDSVPNRSLYDKPNILDDYVRPNGVIPRPIITNKVDNWIRDADTFVSSENPEDEFYYDHWFSDVVLPMWMAWKEQGSHHLNDCVAEDWRRAGQLYFAGKSTPSVV